MANRNWPNKGNMYSDHVVPRMVQCAFKVASTDTAGLGQTGLVGTSYIQNIFMHTSATPGVGNSNPATPQIAITNPNPASGLIVVQFTDPYTRIYGLNYAITSPVGSNVKVDASDAALTIGQAYTITILGDATAADWLALGVPAGVTPAVGVNFIALVTGTGTASVTRVATAASNGSGISSIEILSEASADISPIVQTQGFGGQAILLCRGLSSTSSAPTLTMNSYTPAGSSAAGSIAVTSGTAGNAVTLNAGTTLEATGGGTVSVAAGAFTGTPATLTGTISTPSITTANAITAPAAGSVIRLSFILGDSSVSVGGW